jgi:hypothetical protein
MWVDSFPHFVMVSLALPLPLLLTAVMQAVLRRGV